MHEPGDVSARGRGLRRAAWVLVGLLVASGIGALSLVLPGVTPWIPYFVVYMLSAIVAVAILALASSRSQGHERAFWARLTLSMTLLTAAGLTAIASDAVYPAGVYLIYVVIALLIAAFLAFLAVFIGLTDLRDGDFLERFRHLGDVAIAAAIGIVVTYAFVIGPAYRQFDAPAWTGVLASIMPWLGLLLAMWTLTQLFGTAPSGWTQWERPAVAGMLLFAIGYIWWPLWLLTVGVWHDDLVARVSELLWVGGVLLVGMAALYRVTAPSERWPIQPLSPERRAPRALWVRLVPGIIAVLAITALLVMVPAMPEGSTSRTADVAAAVLLAGLMVLRGALALARSHGVEARAGIDPLTRLRNHRSFHDLLAHRLAVATNPLTVVIIDLDDFEQVDRVSGLAEGDRLIQRVADVVVNSLTGDDEACRLGADEFGLILSDTDTEAGAAIAEHVLAGIRRVDDLAGSKLNASAGVATTPAHAGDPEGLVAAAHRALDYSKYSGKGRATVWSPEVDHALGGADLGRRAREQSYLAAVRSTAAAVDARIPGRGGHSRRVGALALRLARRVGLDEDEARLVETAGQLHDIGKVGVPDAALMPPADELDPDMRRRLEEHPLLGATIAASTGVPEVAPWIAAHHERWDGTGYPEGRAGEAIPLQARIVAVADGYDSFVTGVAPGDPVVGRSAVSHHMREEMNTAYDPLVVLHLLSLLADEEVNAL